MPIFEYECARCGETFEHIAMSGDPAPESSPCCGSPIRRKLSAPAAFRNRVQRPAGKTCCGRDERCETPPCSGGGSCCES
jgi:putative FmdB family regulatory protein